MRGSHLLLFNALFYSHIVYGESTGGELVINVSRGREDSVPFRQSLSGNTSTDTVTIQYVTPGGTGVTQLSDFKTGVTVIVVTVPGEEDLGQSRYQVLCFVAAATADLIPPEAMTKLRQKHPGTVRIAEESRGSTVMEYPVNIIPSRSGHLSKHLPYLCREARDTTFTSTSLLETYRTGGLPRVEKKEEDSFMRQGEVGEGLEGKDRCASTNNLMDSCVCSLDNCVHWFPCSLKYCRNSAGDGEHRCGIRTCSKCTTLRYLTPSRQFCSWDQL